jgi:hypothetical protein
VADQLPDVPDDELPEEKRRGNWRTPTVKCLITQRGIITHIDKVNSLLFNYN